MNGEPEYACTEMRETLEREIKLAPGEGFVFPELGGRAAADAGSSSRPTTTPRICDSRAYGVTLPPSRRGRNGPLAAEAPAGGCAARARAAGPGLAPPGRARRAAPRIPPRRQLVPVARLRTRRETIRAHGAEIVDDSVAVLEGQRVARRFREIEVELIEGDEKDAAAAREGDAPERSALEQGALRPKLLSRARPRQRRAPPRTSEKDTPPGEALGIALEAEYRALLAHDPGTRRGDDPEDLHQLRVATRRLRAFLRAARPLVDKDWADVAPRGARVARRAPRAGARPRRDARPPASRGGRARGRRRGARRASRRARAGARGGLPSMSSRRSAATRYFALLDRLEAAAAPPLTGDETTLAAIFHREAKRMRRTFAALGERSRGRGAARAHGSRSSAPATRRISPPTSSAGRASGSSPSRSRCRTSSATTRTRSSPQARIRDVGRLSTTAGAVRRRAARPARARPDGRGPRRLARRRGSGSTRRPGGRSAEHRRPRRRRGRRPWHRHRDRGAARPPARLRRLDVPEGQGRARRERRGVCRARGRGGDGLALLARARARADLVRRREEAARRWCATG